MLYELRAPRVAARDDAICVYFHHNIISWKYSLVIWSADTFNYCSLASEGVKKGKCSYYSRQELCLLYDTVRMLANPLRL